MALKYSIPFQKIPGGGPFELIRLREYAGGPVRTHRHAFYMLLWTTFGKGLHRVNHRDYELIPGRVCFMMEGQVHIVLEYPADGWMVLFQPELFRGFLHRYPAQAQHGLFSELNRDNDVALDVETAKLFESLLPVMDNIANRTPVDPVLQDLLSVLLFRLNQLYQPLTPLTIHPQQAEQVRKLKLLIERNFKTAKTAPCYSDQLGISCRKLNELTMKLTGKLIQEIIYDRLLSEAESLLGNTGLTVKEITHELGFIDQSHFGFFFKKQKGMTASKFRSQCAGNTDKRTS